jgi:hypothetical protein
LCPVDKPRRRLARRQHVRSCLTSQFHSRGCIHWLVKVKALAALSAASMGDPAVARVTACVTTLPDPQGTTLSPTSSSARCRASLPLPDGPVRVAAPRRVRPREEGRAVSEASECAHTAHCQAFFIDTAHRRGAVEPLAEQKGFTLFSLFISGSLARSRTEPRDVAHRPAVGSNLSSGMSSSAAKVSVSRSITDF